MDKSPNLNTDLRLPPTHSNQNSGNQDSTPIANASNQHLDVMPSTHPCHVSQSSHLSEVSTFSSSYKEQNKYSFKKLKKCFNSFKIIKSLDNDWNFFPVSFLIYVVILLSLTLILSLRYKHSYPIAHTTSLSGSTIDWLVLYSLLLLNIWESLLNFYRFYTTKQCSMLITDSTCTLYLYYALYALSFLILCIVQFHWLYYLFPLVILCHISFNTFCILRFCYILLKQYNSISQPELVIVNDNMLSSVRIMRASSLLSVLMNSLLFASIVSCYAIDLIIYLPLIHSISSFIFSFNFVRNRSSFHHCFTQIMKQIMQSCSSNGVSTNDDHNNDNPRATVTRQPPNTPEISVSNHEEAIEVIEHIEQVDDDVLMMPPSGPSQQTNIVAIMDDAEDEIDDASSTLNTVNVLASCDLATPEQKEEAPVHAPTYVSLTPLFQPATNTGSSCTSRSEPATPLITTQQKQINVLSKTPQYTFATKFSPSPGLLSLNPKHWVKALSLNLGRTAKSVDDDDDDGPYRMVRGKNKKRCQSEQNISQFVTHSISFEKEKDQVQQDLSVFGAADTAVVEESVRLDNDALILSADLVQEVEINENNKNRAVVSFQEYGVFGAMFPDPAEEPRLFMSTSDQQMQLEYESKRNHKSISQNENRRSRTTINTMEIAKAAKAIQFELTMQSIEENEVNYDLPQMKMLQLMVQHGFYSKKKKYTA